MKIIKTTTLVEFPETLEDGNAKIISDKPYMIERIEKFGCITWYGYNTNWQKHPFGPWKKLVDGVFVPCDEPEYEKLFKKNNEIR